MTLPETRTAVARALQGWVRAPTNTPSKAIEYLEQLIGEVIGAAEKAYVERDTDYTVTDVQSAFISAPELVLAEDGVLTLQFYAPTVEIGANATVNFAVSTNGIDGGIFAHIDLKNSEVQMPIAGTRRVALSAGAYTFGIAAGKTGTDPVVVRAGAGGAGNYFPMALRITERL
jgi:hypothetical protein